MTSVWCHNNVTPMRIATIRKLKHATNAVLDWVEKGERVEIQRRGQSVAVLSRPVPAKHKKPDFAARLKSIYGAKMLKTTATELLATERGGR